MSVSVRNTPHVFENDRFNKDAFDSRLCVCGAPETNRVHNHEVIMEYFDRQIKELKERLNEVPPTKDTVKVTVIVSGSKTTEIYDMEMKNFGVAVEWSQPSFEINGDPYMLTSKSQYVENIQFAGKPVIQKDGTSYNRIVQER